MSYRVGYFLITSSTCFVFVCVCAVLASYSWRVSRHGPVQYFEDLQHHLKMKFCRASTGTKHLINYERTVCSTTKRSTLPHNTYILRFCRSPVVYLCTQSIILQIDVYWSYYRVKTVLIIFIAKYLAYPYIHLQNCAW